MQTDCSSLRTFPGVGTDLEPAPVPWRSEQEAVAPQFAGCTDPLEELGEGKERASRSTSRALSHLISPSAFLDGLLTPLCR